MTVRYLGATDEQVAFGSCADPRDCLEVGKVYEVQSAAIHDWHTKLWLVGVDSGQGFNSVSFEDVDEVQP